METTPLVTLVVPAYNEEHRLPGALTRLKTFCGMQLNPCEIIVVDDGSSDRTCDVALAATKAWANLRLVQEPHCGRGGAIRAGVLAAQGQYVAIMPVGMTTSVYDLAKFDARVFAQCDVAVASREAFGPHKGSLSALPRTRALLFNALVRATVLTGFADPQCGIKVMPRQIAVDICRYQRIDGPGVDVEWLVIALRQGYRVGEVPIGWYPEKTRRWSSPIRDSLSIARELWAIRRNLMRGRYDPDGATDVPDSQLESVMADTKKRPAIASSSDHSS